MVSLETGKTNASAHEGVAVMRKPAAVLIVLSLAVLALALVPAAGLAAKGGTTPGGGGHGNGSAGDGGGSTATTGVPQGGGSTSGCTQNAPSVAVDNNYAWASPGSWGMPGQQLTYAIKVTNNDVGCGSASFVVALSAPDGFSVSLPTSTLSLKSTSLAYLSAYVTSPTTATDGTYTLSATVQRAGTGTAAAPASANNYYMVYSSDTAAPTLFWPSPEDGATLSGRSYTVAVVSRDDHAVRRIELYIDDSYRATSACDDISYTCQLSYKWSINRARGQHTVTFKSYDWMGNVGSLNVTVTVG